MISRYRSSSDGRAMNLDQGPKAASVAIDQDELLTHDSAGNLIPAVTDSTHIVGASITAIVATDENFASNDEIQFDIPLAGDEFIMDVDDAGTAGFVAGVTRAILDSKTVKAAADAGNPNFIVIKEVLVADDKAVVTLLTNAA